MSGEESKGTTRVNQEHFGSGDNVNIKNVHNAISLSALLEPIHQILTCLRHRDKSTAASRLQALVSTSELDKDAKAVLDVVSLLIQLSGGETPENGHTTVDSCLHTDATHEINDICISTKLRLYSHNDRNTDARDLFVNVASPSYFTKEAFFELIADKSELEEALADKSNLRNEIILSGLIRGLIRCGMNQEASELSQRLCADYPSFNSKVIDLIIRCNCLNQTISANNYWLISASERDELLRLADACIDLLEECEASDTRTVNLISGFLRFIADSHKPLVDAGWKYIKKIEAVDSDVATILRILRDKDTDGLGGLAYEMQKARSDAFYKDSAIERLKSCDLMSPEDLILFGNIADNSTIQEWLDNGGVPNVEDEFEREFLELELRAHASDGKAQSVSALRKSLDSFVQKNQAHLHKLNPLRLHDLVLTFLDLGLPVQICDLLKPIIPEKDLWLSPVVKIYINALLGAQKLTTLRQILSEIKEPSRDEFWWQAKARQLDYQNQLNEAIKAIEVARQLSPDSLSIWHYSVHLLKRNNTDPEEYKAYLDTFPKALFSTRNKESIQLLFEFSCNGYDELVEKVIISWFLSQPEDSARDITDFHVSEMARGNEGKTRKLSETTDTCLGGVRYLIEGKEITKLIVSGVEPKHPSIIKDNSPLAEQLLSMKVGETKQHGPSELKLLEKIPPCIAVFRVAMDIREAANDGSDSFYRLSLPDDPEEYAPDITRRLSALQKNSKQDTLKDPSYALYLRGKMLNIECPVKSALRILGSKEFIKSALPTVGVDNPSNLILDVYSATYLALTGLVFGIESSETEIIITSETQRFLRQFTDNLDRDDYMSAGLNPEGQLLIFTSEDIKAQLADVQRAIQHILEIATIEHPEQIDMPSEIVQIQNFIDPSVFSSLKLSITNDIPWLSMDEIFATLAHNSGYPVANTFSTLTKFGRNLEIEKKLPGIYLNVNAGLPFPLTYTELIQLCQVDIHSSHNLLARLLEMYPSAFDKTEAAVDFLHKLVLVALSKFFEQIRSFANLCDSGPSIGSTEKLINGCFSFVLRLQDGEEAELRLAKLFHAIFTRGRSLPHLCDAVSIMAGRFLQGHFLDVERVNEHLRAMQERG